MAKFTGHSITSDSALGSAVIQRSLRFNKGDSPYLSRTPAAQGDRRVFTLSWWMKLGQAGVTTPTTTISVSYTHLTLPTNREV